MTNAKNAEKTSKMTTYVKYSDTIRLLKEYGELIDEQIFPAVTPFHGSCCCCQRCGQDHDSCVCSNNALYKEILKLEKLDIPDNEM